MKNIRFFMSAALALVLAAGMLLPVFAAEAATETIQAYSISSGDLMKRVKDTVKTGEITYTSLYNISEMPKADLQQSSEEARKRGGKVFFYFDTLVNDRVTGRIVVNPFLVKENDSNLSLILDTSTVNNKPVIDKFTKIFNRKVAVMRCTQTGSFGMTVVLAGKLDLADMDTANLIAYTYEATTNKYSKIEAANCTVDAQGFVYLESKLADYIVITTVK